jgi:excisionase family DNA binding protein
VTRRASTCPGGDPERRAVELRLVLDDEALTGIAEQVAEILRSRPKDGESWAEWLNVSSAARYLDCSPERIRKLVARRAIPFHQEDVGCRVMFSRPDLDAWMKTFRHAPQGGGA